jgi:N-acyl-D-amino-acid deacylase
MAPFDETPPALNIMTFVGHNTIRRQIMGADYKRAATADEVARMAELVETGMREGAIGLSSGLEYDPGFYSTRDEVVALAKIAAKYGGIYMTHMRDEADKVMDALKESIEIGRLARIPVQISHIKLGTVGVWGKTAQMLAEIDGARARGIDVSADAYPYTAWSSNISVLVPSRKFDDPAAVAKGLADVGGAGNVLITRYAKDPAIEFKTLEEIAKARNPQNDGPAGAAPGTQRARCYPERRKCRCRCFRRGHDSRQFNVSGPFQTFRRHEVRVRERSHGPQGRPAHRSPPRPRASIKRGRRSCE